MSDNEPDQSDSHSPSPLCFLKRTLVNVKSALNSSKSIHSRRPEASSIPTTKLKQPALHWAQVVSVMADLTSDLDWPALAAFFLLTCRGSNASSFFS